MCSQFKNASHPESLQSTWDPQLCERPPPAELASTPQLPVHTLLDFERISADKLRLPPLLLQPAQYDGQHSPLFKEIKLIDLLL